MIEVKNVTKKYGSFVAVDDISFTINDGEVVGFLGPNGAGKSTTMNMITGYIEQTEGNIIVDGFDTLKKSKKAKKEIADIIIIPDEPTVGLDPKQITEIRSLIKNLGKKHTVILSSHILSEVSQICDRVIIINKGKIVAIDTPENLEKKVSDNNIVYVTVEDKENKIDGIKEKITGIKEIKLVKENEDKTKQYEITGENDVNLNKTIFNEFAKENITIVEMKKAEATLEDAFMKIIKEGGDK